MTAATAFRPRVLLACDDPALRRSLAAALAACPVDVFEQPDASDVLEFVLWGEPAIVWLALSGPAQMRRLRVALARCRRVRPVPPFVLIGMAAALDAAPAGRAVGAFDHVVARDTAPDQIAALVRQSLAARPRPSEISGGQS